MDERDFELLDILEKTKNITHAADLLYVTQSSLSKRITAIENELGVTLLILSLIHILPLIGHIKQYCAEEVCSGNACKHRRRHAGKTEFGRQVRHNDTG